VEKKYGEGVHEIFEMMKRRQAHEERGADSVITTAHKVKGQEYGSVVVLPDFVRLRDILEKTERAAEGPLAAPPVTASREEFQLVYVAATRSFGSLFIPKPYLIGGGDVRRFKSLVRRKRILFS
jgi:superfamily I DNA/RNA helicase